MFISAIMYVQSLLSKIVMQITNLPQQNMEKAFKAQEREENTAKTFNCLRQWYQETEELWSPNNSSGLMDPLLGIATKKPLVIFSYHFIRVPSFSLSHFF